MGRDSILDEAEQNEDESESEQGSGTAPVEGGSTSDSENDGDSERARVTQRIPADILADVNEVQDRYALPSRNAAINFILKHGTNDLLGDGG